MPQRIKPAYHKGRKFCISFCPQTYHAGHRDATMNLDLELYILFTGDELGQIRELLDQYAIRIL